MRSNHNMQQDFMTIAKRLLHVDDVPNELGLHYEQAVHKIDTKLSNYQQKVWNRMLQYPILFHLYDSGFALVKPDALIRRRVFIALAILECNPYYTDYFLSTKVSTWDIIKLLVELPLAVIYGMIGGLLVYFKI